MSERAYAAVAYIRVSTGEQRESGLGLEAQRAAVTAEAERRGWELAQVFEDAGASGKTLKGRPGLLEALAAVEEGSADVLLAPSSTGSRGRWWTSQGSCSTHTGLRSGTALPTYYVCPTWSPTRTSRPTRGHMCQAQGASKSTCPRTRRGV